MCCSCSILQRSQLDVIFRVAGFLEFLHVQYSKGNVVGVLYWFVLGKHLWKHYFENKHIFLINLAAFMWISILECCRNSRKTVQVLLTLYAIHIWKKNVSFCDILATVFCYNCTSWLLLFFFSYIIYWLWFYEILHI